MSNTEQAPQETVCRNEPPRDANGLSSGVQTLATGAGPVELLEPRAVPLGGPRAMTVHRTLPQRARSLIGAWCFLDAYGPDDVAATGGMAVARHPHTGLATVSWLFEGQVDHLDSAGNAVVVRPGEVHLMNAGRGITHSEFSTADTSVLHGAQLWYAFPDHARFAPPSLESHRPEPVAGDGWTAKVFLGSLLGVASPVTTHLPLTGAELRLAPGASLVLDVPPEHEHGLLQVAGAVRLDGVELPDVGVGYVGPGRREITVAAGDAPVTALFLGGEPLGEQIIMWWNFVGRTHEEVAAWRAGYQREIGADDASPADASPADAAAAEPETRWTGAEMFGPFPAGQPAALPAPRLPDVRIRPRG